MYHSDGSRPHQTGPRNSERHPLRLFERRLFSTYPNHGCKMK